MDMHPKLVALWIITALAGCSVDAVTFKLTPVMIGVTITGLDGDGLVLTNNGGDDLVISGNGAFVFTTPLERGASYALVVKRQPSNPLLLCAIANGTGTVGDEDVTDVQVSCHATAFHVGGTVTGVAGSGLVLRNNDGDDLNITANGMFAFSTVVPNGAPYHVTVQRQPAGPWQTCTVTGGAGTATSAEVTSTVVTCTTNLYSLGGEVTGLATGNSVTLRNNGSDELVLTRNGSYRFQTPVASGQGYRVTFVAISMPLISQTCFLLNNFDSVRDSDINFVFVMCSTNRFTVGGTISGLTGTGLVLNYDRGGDIPFSGNGAFTFPGTIPSGTMYTVTVKTQPSGQTCVVANGPGTVGSSNVTNIQVTCG